MVEKAIFTVEYENINNNGNRATQGTVLVSFFKNIIVMIK